MICLLYRHIFLDVSLSTLRPFISSFFRNVYIECLLTGNLLQEEALAITENVHKIVFEETRARPMLPVQHMMYREYNLPEGLKIYKCIYPTNPETSRFYSFVFTWFLGFENHSIAIIFITIPFMNSKIV